MAQDQVTAMVQDPDFAKLPLADQQKALAAHDPTFGSLGPADVTRFVQAHQAKLSAGNATIGPTPTGITDPENKVQASGVKLPDMENYTQEGRIAHPVLSKIGDLISSGKELLTGGQSAGKPMGTSSGVMDNPVTSAILGSLGAPKGAATLVDMVPNAGRASEMFNSVAATVGKHTVPITEDIGKAAFRVQQLADTGSQMPKVMKQFIQRASTSTTKPITYDEARLFYSNASRLARNEFDTLTPVMQRAVSMFTQSLGDGITQVAANAGKGEEFANAMSTYRNAKKIGRVGEAAKDVAMKTIREAIPFGAAAYAGKKIWEATK